MRIARLLLATGPLLVCPALASPAGAAATGNPVVYHSPDGLGAPAAVTPWVIAAVDGTQLHLFIDYENDGEHDPSSPSGVMCVSRDGDETCAFDVLITMTTSPEDDDSKFSDFVAAGPGIVGRIDPDTSRTLRVNGIDVNGMPMPASIGTLTVDAAQANQIQIEVEGRHRVGAAGQMDGIQERVIAMPEPGALWLQASGIGAVALLAHRRRRRCTRRG
jgi:hypothetical protein